MGGDSRDNPTANTSSTWTFHFSHFEAHFTTGMPHTNRMTPLFLSLAFLRERGVREGFGCFPLPPRRGRLQSTTSNQGGFTYLVVMFFVVLIGITLMADGRIVQSRFLIKDGLQMSWVHAKKGLFGTKTFLTVKPNGEMLKGLPKNRPDLIALERKLKSPLKIQYYSLYQE